MKVLLTGAAGFIGYHTCERLLKRGDAVVGVDNVNDYYDVRLKKARLDRLQKQAQFSFYKQDMDQCDELDAIFKKEKPERVINLAAQAGVRYSLTNPHAYVQSNLVGFVNILEACRYHQVEHLA